MGRALACQSEGEVVRLALAELRALTGSAALKLFMRRLPGHCPHLTDFTGLFPFIGPAFPKYAQRASRVRALDRWGGPWPSWRLHFSEELDKKQINTQNGELIQGDIRTEAGMKGCGAEGKQMRFGSGHSRAKVLREEQAREWGVWWLHTCP